MDVFAIEKYSQCPKQLTIVENATLPSDSGFYCIPMNNCAVHLGANTIIREFIVPQQCAIIAKDRKYGLFSVLRVTDITEGPDYWLVTSVKSLVGFLLPFDKLPQELLEKEAVRT